MLGFIIGFILGKSCIPNGKENCIHEWIEETDDGNFSLGVCIQEKRTCSLCGQVEKTYY